MDNTYAFKIPGATVSVTVTPDAVETVEAVVEAPVETTPEVVEAPVETTEAVA